MDRTATSIVAAVVAGALAAARDVAPDAVAAAYRALLDLIRDRFHAAVPAVDRVEADLASSERREALARDLQASGASADEEVQAAARDLLAAIIALRKEPGASGLFDFRLLGVAKVMNLGDIGLVATLVRSAFEHTGEPPAKPRARTSLRRAPGSARPPQRSSPATPAPGPPTRSKPDEAEASWTTAEPAYSAPPALEDASAAEEPQPVYLGAAAPRGVRPGAAFTARFFAYVDAERDTVAEILQKRAAGSTAHMDVAACQWAVGTRVTVRLTTADGVSVDPSEETFEWNGRYVFVDFDVDVQRAAPLGFTVLRFDVFVGGLRIARLRFDLEIATQPAAGTEAPSRVEGPAARTAFASYASADAKRVTDRVSALRAVGIDVFLDRLSLTPGQRWNPALEREIVARELFILFWSQAAQASQWVDWEWRLALERKGLDAIVPSPLEPVSLAPPPPELSELHFGDPLIAIREQLDPSAQPATKPRGTAVNT